MKAEIKKAKIHFRNYLLLPGKALVIKKPVIAEIECEYKSWFSHPRTTITSEELGITAYGFNGGIDKAIEDFSARVRSFIDLRLREAKKSDDESMRKRAEAFEEHFVVDYNDTFVIVYQEEPGDSGPLPGFHSV